LRFQERRILNSAGMAIPVQADENVPADLGRARVLAQHGAEADRDAQAAREPA
jgi:hypothetical protein